MKCPSCGAEIANGKKCQYCGTQITAEMQREQERLNRDGCPMCKSTDVQFKRENQGEVKNKKGRTVLHQTVAVCNNCGYTWYPNGIQKPRKTWLWVLGWIFIFPLPLTIILLKKKDMKPALKYGIIAAAWVIYLIFIIGARSSDNKNDAEKNTDPSSSVSESLSSEGDKDKGIVDSQPSDTEPAPSESEPAPSESEPAPSESEPAPSESEPAIDQTLIRPDIKAAIDAYEAVIDEYCDFMRKADQSDAAFYASYLKFMTKLADEEKKFNAIADKELTQAEDSYYSIVMTRCSAKLLEFSLTLN